MTREKYIYEHCSICGEIIANIEDVYVDLDTDNYVCQECADFHKLKVNRCLEYTEDEEVGV